MRRILEITDKINRGIIDKHNQQVDQIVKSRPELAHLSQSMKVEQPPPYGEGPPVPGQGAAMTTDGMCPIRLAPANI